MSDADRWHELNDLYLGAALEWLRLRLERAAAGMESEVEEEAVEDPIGPQDSLRDRLFGGRSGPDPRRALPSGTGPSETDVAEAAGRMEEAGRTDPPPALLRLARRLGLSPFERSVLLLAAAPELDPRIGELCARAQGDRRRTHGTFALAMRLFDDPAWDVVSPHRPLRYWRLVEILQPGAEPLTTSALRAEERITNHLKGLDYLDDRLTPLLVPFDAARRPTGPERDGPGDAPEGEGASDEDLPASQVRSVDRVERALRRAAATGGPAVVQVVGPDPHSRQVVAGAAARRLGLNLYRLPQESLPRGTDELETLARLWERESLLLPIALFLDVAEPAGDPGGEGTSPAASPSLERFLARSGGVFLLGAREPRPSLGSRPEAVEVDRPTPAEQRSLWEEALDAAAGGSPARLAGQFNLDAGTIRSVAERARAEREDADESDEDASLHRRLWDACLARTAPRMDRLAQRLRPVATWDDLVLPAEPARLLRRVAGQVARRATVYDEWGFRERMNRGLGISALFVGESGTGKTMAAEVMANDLRLNLYRIDLSAVVSKYIGETEKNLRRVFDAAEDGGAILFFDEADALFGKRSEVKDSHDRYANIEVNYLLQRMEAYRGLAILATNMKSALDPAFLRRIRFIVRFPFPDRVLREAIWRRAWPGETPVAGLDFGRLARFNLTGGSIHNVALNAAFDAAAADRKVDMPLVLEAIRTELDKLERPYRDSELKWEVAS